MIKLESSPGTHYCRHKKCWFWFTKPREVFGAAMVNFFSYHDVSLAGFIKREGLTSVIDLTAPLNTIWNNLRPKFIREQIRKGEKGGITTKLNCDFIAASKLYRLFRRDRRLPSDHWPSNQSSFLLTAYRRDQLLAMGLFVTDGVYCRAWALASGRSTGETSRELIGQANRIIVWEAIKQTKSTGHRLFDLGGISPDSRNLHLRSLAEFKEAFGGERLRNYYYYKVYSLGLRLWFKLRRFIRL